MNNTTALCEAYDENVRPIIDLIDKLRMIGLENDISLPTVVVIGDQSSGKSSVLEAISGIQLPRGSGIVTRCPLELKMKNSSVWSSDIQYNTISGERIEMAIETSDNVERIIRNAQIAMTAGSKDISEELISLSVSGNDVPDLSIVDLPGIARIAVAGQSSDICNKIKKIIHKYAERENTVMLCVIPCNQDVATNESLNIARLVDPEGKRTLGVLTKPDLIDKGTEKDILKLISNKLYQLKKGYSVIKCRSQKEIDDGISVHEARKIEEAFFENHEHFCDVYNDGLAGVNNLANKLTIELVQHIKSNIPTVREQLQNELKATQTKYEDLGKDPPSTESEKHMHLIEVGNDISRNFEELSKGIYSSNDTPEEYRMYAIVYQYFERLSDILQENEPKKLDKKLIEKIRSELHSQRGVELPPFLSYNVCKQFIALHLKRVKASIYSTIHSAANSIFNSASFVIDKYTQGYCNLRSAYIFEMQRIHSEMLRNCQDSVNLLLVQEEFPFTMDRAYYKFAKADAPDWLTALQNSTEKIFCEHHQHQDSPSNSKLSKYVVNFSELSKDDDDGEIIEGNAKTCKSHQCLKCLTRKKPKVPSREEIMADNLSNYMKVAFTRLMDNIAMTVIYHLLRKFSNELRLALARFANNSENCKLLSEEKSREKERHKLKSKIERLQKGLIEIAKFSA